MSELPRVIAMHGDPGSGKDTVGGYLVEHHGYTRLAFADRLKEACEALNPIIGYRDDLQLRNQLADGEHPTFVPMRLQEAVARYGWDEAKRLYPEVRRTQRYLATEVVRDLVDPTYWVDYVEAQIPDYERVVITDLRFPNEAEMVWRHSGQIWWVKRPDSPYHFDMNHRSEDWHPSSEWDVPIRNAGTLEDLHEMIESALAMGLKRV